MQWEHLRKLVADAGRATTRCSECGATVVIDTEPPHSGACCPDCGGEVQGSDGQEPFPGPGTVFGEYEIERELGRGGSGVVFLARDAGRHGEVAVKVLLETRDDPRDHARLHREARAIADVHHPAIVDVYEVGEFRGRPYVVMEYVRGPTLRRASLSLRAFVTVLRDVALALEEAHRLGIVHRDVKPENILVGEDGRPRLVDFGVARVSGRTMTITREGQLAGTPHYMAPEHLEGKADSALLDVYALGVILYERLAGKPPFDGDRPGQVISAILRGAPRLPSRVRPGVDRRLEAVALKAMARVPGGRYPSAGDLASDLDRWLRGGSVRARRPSPLARSVWRRRRRIVSLAAILVVALLTLLAAWQWDTNRIREAERSSLATVEAALDTYDRALLAPAGPLEPEREALRQRLDSVRTMYLELPQAHEMLLGMGRLEGALGLWDRSWRSLSAALEELDGRVQGDHYVMRAEVISERLLEVPFLRDRSGMPPWWNRQISGGRRLVNDLEAAARHGGTLPSWRREAFEAQKLISQDRSEAALFACERALQVSDLPRAERAEVLLLKGIALLLEHHEEQARHAFDQAARIKRSDVRCLLGAIVTRIDGDRAELEEALRLADEILLIDPDYEPVLLPAGCLWERAGERAADRGEDPWPFYERALDAFERVATGNSGWFALARLATLRCTRTHWLVEQGESRRATAEIHRAMSAARRLRQVDPSQRCAWIVEIHALEQLAVLQSGDEGEAVERSIEAFGRLLTEHPGAEDLLVQRARSHVQLGKWVANTGGDPASHWERAERDLAEALAQNPRAASTYEALGDLRWRRCRGESLGVGELEAAERDFTRALELDPRRIAARIYRGAVRRLRAAQQEDVALLRAALKDLESALEEAPRHAGARIELAEALYELKDFRGANREYRRAVELDPELAASATRLGAIDGSSATRKDDG